VGAATPVRLGPPKSPELNICVVGDLGVAPPSQGVLFTRQNDLDFNSCFVGNMHSSLRKQMRTRRRLAAITFFGATILISDPASTFSQSRRVKLNENAFAYAKELITRGNVTVDKKNEWQRHHPTAQEENEFIRAHGFAEYGKWHLGIDQSHGEKTKTRYKFPFGDFKNVHRSGLLAVKSRAHQFGYSDIENAAERLLEMMGSPRK
jgi:hypothetical protein